ncbi:Fe-S cluster assembly protein SufB [Thermosporothrix hazakensis]|jgi:Fe-S cluster assembly protein SufB|uniref:Fe-S cluster assembly protein SufB n=2 Tax=Thermosporothrix TaxID=768650 RepID=A0A326UFQ3_THEHA|nr:Fe-S cluster assembly protein SufB [Thermosporothrix hazakensis]PZW36681.1 Fe-S cluster assembly protein SufB [Thermosporothrix hazakensis]GCE47332.1 Fe-S cluster assembly protein SufB [Thermosporothrix hazakensis]
MSQAFELEQDTYSAGFHVPENYAFKSEKGLNERIVAQISEMKGEPSWMRDFRLKSLKLFERRPMPTWGADLSGINFDDIYYYIKPVPQQGKSWDDVPSEIKETFDRLGIPQAEQKYLAGVTAQYESEAVYHKVREDLEKLGVIFTDMDTALREYPDLVKEHFGTIVPPSDNKFASLNSAVWSGGSFVYVPANVRVEIPLQAYFRINARNMGQFERTLIIAEPGSYVHYVEGCTAPNYTDDSLHSAVVEIKVKEGARVRYTTIQNWSKNVYNLVTKRAAAYRDATMEWVDGNLGSKVTMKYPAVLLMEPGARGDVLSVAFAGDGQHQDAGAKITHLAPHTTSQILSKSVSKGSGRSSYRGLIRINPGAHHTKSSVRCDALLLDEQARTDTYPTIRVEENMTEIGHEATVSKVGEDQLFYLMSRGLDESEAYSLIVNGFIEPITKELPMEYAVELNRLIQLEMSGSVG